MSEAKVECPRCVRGQTTNPVFFRDRSRAKEQAKLVMASITDGLDPDYKPTWVEDPVPRLVRCDACDGTGYATRAQAAAYLLEHAR